MLPLDPGKLIHKLISVLWLWSLLSRAIPCRIWETDHLIFILVGEMEGIGGRGVGRREDVSGPGFVCVCVVCFLSFFFSLRESVFLFTFLQSIAFTLVLAIVSGQKMVLIFFLKKSFCDDVSLATELRDVLYNHHVDRPHWSFFFPFYLSPGRIGISVPSEKFGFL